MFETGRQIQQTQLDTLQSIFDAYNKKGLSEGAGTGAKKPASRARSGLSGSGRSPGLPPQGSGRNAAAPAAEVLARSRG